MRRVGLMSDIHTEAGGSSALTDHVQIPLTADEPLATSEGLLAGVHVQSVVHPFSDTVDVERVREPTDRFGLRPGHVP